MMSEIRYKRTSHCTAKNGEYNTGKNRGKKRVLAALLILVEPMIDGLFVHKVSPENNSDCQSVPSTRTKTDSAPIAACPPLYQHSMRCSTNVNHRFAKNREGLAPKGGIG